MKGKTMKTEAMKMQEAIKNDSDLTKYGTDPLWIYTEIKKAKRLL